MYSLTCPVCNRAFTGRRSDARFCSTTCRSTVRRARDAELHALAVELLLADAEGDAYDPGDPKAPGYLDGILDSASEGV